ncbi:SDR family NAD(P)-dependent oxidoreductase [Saccharicrinis sp. 156]|uniref:SDR family NAD(P)-dependent oxidoreductase n=1 Tax=Saccharicrinis sp. 156 TaxID=3417574 RepID=UPI003D32D83E
MRKALVIGGSNGIGLSIVKNLQGYDKIYIVDRQVPDVQLSDNISYERFDLRTQDYSIFKKYNDVDSLIITSGIGRLALFEDVGDSEIEDLFYINTIAVIRIIKQFYERINSKQDFFCAIMGSISGLLSSPFFSVYGATKAAVCKFVESVNVELEKGGSVNRILNVSPGSIKGTSFYKEETNIDLTTPLALDIIENMYARNDLFIPQYQEVFKGVLDRYNKDFRKFGLESYEYKKMSERLR